MLPAAPVTTTTESGARARARIGRRSRALFQADGETDPGPPTDLDDAGVAERLLDKGCGHVARSGVGFDVEDLDRGGRALPRQGLGEAAHGTGHGAAGTEFVVPVGPAVAGCRDDERSDLAEAVVQLAGCGGEQLDAHPQAFVPPIDVEVGDGTLVVEGGEGVEPIDRSGGQPIGELPGKCLGIGRHVDGEHLDAAIGQLRRQRFSHPTGVGKDDDSGAGRQPHAGRREPVQRRSHDRYRHAAWESGVVDG